MWRVATGGNGSPGKNKACSHLRRCCHLLRKLTRGAEKRGDLCTRRKVPKQVATGGRGGNTEGPVSPITRPRSRRCFRVHDE